MKKIFYQLLILILLLPANVQAASGEIPSLNKTNNRLIPSVRTDKSFIQMIAQVLDTFLLVLVIAALLANILAGVKYITAGGDSAKVEKAKKELFYAFIGLVLVTATWYIIMFALDIADINKPFPTAPVETINL